MTEKKSRIRSLVEQLNLRNARNEHFHRSALVKSSRLFLFYRFSISSYFVTWFIAQASVEDLPKHFIYLTTWGESLLNAYFITAFAMSTYLYMNPECVFDRLSGAVYCLQCVSNFFRIIAFDMGISLSIAYWTLLRTEDTAFSYHVHLCNAIAIILDIIMTDIPIYLIQFVWSSGVGVVYIIHSLLLYYFSDDEEYRILYKETLDWGNYPYMSMAVVLSVCFLVMPGAHSFQYFVFSIKQRCLPNYLANSSNLKESGSDMELSDINNNHKETRIELS